MLALLDQTEGPFAPNETEALIAREGAERLRELAKLKQNITLYDKEQKIFVPLSARTVELIYKILNAMGQGVPLSLIPHEAELTTQQAADFLNVSRPYLTRLIDKGEITHRVVGRHRRVKFSDLLEYDRKSKERRRRAILKMAEEERVLELD